jgi:hypothetical protein
MGKSTSTVTIPNPWTFLIGSSGTGLVIDSGLDDINIDAGLDDIRIKEIADSTVNSNIAITQPIVTDSTVKSESDSRSTIDMKPLAVDSCQTIKLAPLPPLCVEQPYAQHFGFTFMGIELWGFTMSGKSEMRLHSPPSQKYHSYAVPGSESKAPCPEPTPHAPPKRSRGGISVRIGRKDD